MIELCDEARNAIESIIGDKGIAEVKIEKGKIVVVEISRKLKCKIDGETGCPAD